MPDGWLHDRNAPLAPDWTREGEFLYRRVVRFGGLGVRLWAAPFAGGIKRAEELCFYDTETTGLSGGAGTLIFLLGTAWCEGDDLVVEQLFLSDFPGEEQFLQAAAERFSRHAAFVSYNGKAFDSRILATRFLMNRMLFEPGPQVDLLHHARRLWRSVAGECSLGSIERSILGVTRGIDVAGEDVPLIYFDFLKTGQPGLLPVVFQHNMTDVTSLARMYSAIGRLLDGDLAAVPVDERALGRWMLARGAVAGAALLDGSFAHGNLEAGVELSLHHKRKGEWERAALIWQTIVERSPSMVAAVELAKYLEHRLRSPDRALAVVERLLAWNLPLTAHARAELGRRRMRLERKLARPTAPRARGRAAYNP